MGKVILVWTILVLIEIFAVVAFGSSERLTQNMRREFIAATQWLEEGITERLYDRADKNFRALFVDTGVAPGSYRLFIPSADNQTNDMTEGRMARGVVDWFDAKLDALWLTFLVALQRAILFAYWFPYLVIFLVPVAIDGWMQRAIKKTNFGVASSVRYNAALFLCIGLLFLPFAYFVLPIAGTPLFAPMWAVATSVVVILLAANVQKVI